jgi:hypothetical protein
MDGGGEGGGSGVEVWRTFGDGFPDGVEEGLRLGGHAGQDGLRDEGGRCVWMLRAVCLCIYHVQWM